MRHLVAIALLGGVTVAAQAGHGDLGYYISPSIGYVDADDERGTDSGLSYGIAVGRPWCESRNLELDLKMTDLDGAEVISLGLSLLNYMGEGHSKLYSIARLGLNSSDGHPGEDYESVSLGGGLGYRMPLMGYGDLRVEATLNADLHSNRASSENGQKLFFIDPALTLGYQIPLGKQAKATRPSSDVAVVPAGADSDDDGIADDADLCPGTPAGTSVDSTGCAPAVAPVTATDCPTPDADDAVDANGCAVKSGTLLTEVYFEFDSTELTDAARDKLDEAATNVAGGSGRIEVAGHSSDEGDRYYNVDLSQRRAYTVRRYLIDAGVSPARIFARGYGNDAPQTSGASASDRRANRRVELRLVD